MPKIPGYLKSMEAGVTAAALLTGAATVAYADHYSNSVPVSAASRYRPSMANLATDMIGVMSLSSRRDSSKPPYSDTSPNSEWANFQTSGGNILSFSVYFSGNSRNPSRATDIDVEVDEVAFGTQRPEAIVDISANPDGSLNSDCLNAASSGAGNNYNSFGESGQESVYFGGDTPKVISSLAANAVLRRAIAAVEDAQLGVYSSLPPTGHGQPVPVSASDLTAPCL